MSFLAWMVLGFVAGFIGSKVVKGKGVVLDIPLGIIGAVVSGLVSNGSGSHGVSGLNLHSLLVAAVGSVLVLAVYHALFRRV